MAKANRSRASGAKAGAAAVLPDRAQPPATRARAGTAQPGIAGRPDLSDQARARLEEMIVSLELAPGSDVK